MSLLREILRLAVAAILVSTFAALATCLFLIFIGFGAEDINP